MKQKQIVLPDFLKPIEFDMDRALGRKSSTSAPHSMPRVIPEQQVDMGEALTGYGDFDFSEGVPLTSNWDIQDDMEADEAYITDDEDHEF